MSAIKRVNHCANQMRANFVHVKVFIYYTRTLPQRPPREQQKVAVVRRQGYHMTPGFSFEISGYIFKLSQQCCVLASYMIII